jgi:hypothetical protein
MYTAVMRQAMNTLKTFSEKERAYHRYQARQNYLRQQKSIENHRAGSSLPLVQIRRLQHPRLDLHGNHIDAVEPGAVIQIIAATQRRQAASMMRVA